MMKSTFLVIEDQPLSREIISTALMDAGFKVTAFESAEAFHAQPIPLSEICVAIIDLTLPGMSGLELSRQLRQSCPRLGIIMLTMHDAVATKLQAYEAGIDIYLTKPIDNNELIATSKALIKRLPKSALSKTPALYFDQVKQQLFCESGACENLSFREAKTLNAFLQASQFQLEYWELLEINQIDLGERGRKQLEVRISRLRRKLKTLTASTRTIQPIRGFGYQLNVMITPVYDLPSD